MKPTLAIAALAFVLAVPCAAQTEQPREYIATLTPGDSTREYWREWYDRETEARETRIAASEPYVTLYRIQIALQRIADALEAWSQNYDTGNDAIVTELEKRVRKIEQALAKKPGSK